MSLSKGALKLASVAEQILAAKNRAAILSRPVDTSPSRFLADFRRGNLPGEVKVFPLTKEGDLEATKSLVYIAFEVKQTQPGKLQLWYVPPFRLSADSGERAGWVLLDSQPVWEECLADLPWSDKVRLSRLAAFIVEHLPLDDVRARQESLHFAWELAVNKNRHGCFSPDLLVALLSVLVLNAEPGSKATCLLSLVTIWSLSVSAGLRRQLITLGAVERLLVLLVQLKDVPCAAAALSHSDQRRLRECVMGCLSVFLCDAQARARMYVPDAEELGLAITGSTGWSVLTHYAQAETEPGSLARHSRSARELAAEALCTVLWRDPLGTTIFLRTGGIGHLLRLLRSDSPTVQRAAVGALCKYMGTDSGRALLATRGRELPETLRRLADLLRNVSKRPRHKEEKELFAAIADGAAAALWGAAKTMLSTKVPIESSDLSSLLAVITDGRRGLRGSSANRFIAVTAALLAADAATASKLAAVNAQVPLGLLASSSDAAAAAAAVAALALVAEQELRNHKDGSTFRGQLDGPHRVHLVKNGALTSLVAAAARFPQDTPLCRAVAAGIMYLAGPGRDASETELYETVRLVESTDARTSLYASCALWCFARNLKNRAKIGRVNGIQALIVAGRRVYESVQSKPSQNPPDPADTKALEFILAAVWLLLTHDANHHFLERAAQYKPPPERTYRSSSLEGGVRLTVHSNPSSPRGHEREPRSSLLTDLSKLLETPPERLSQGENSITEETEEQMELERAGDAEEELSQRNAINVCSPATARLGLPGRKVRPSSAGDSPSTGILGGSASTSFHSSASGRIDPRGGKKNDHTLRRQRSHVAPVEDVFSQLVEDPGPRLPRLPKLPQDDPPSGPGAEVKGLDFLVGLIAVGGSLEHRAWDASKYLAVKAVKFATQQVLEFERKVIDLGIGAALAAIAKNPEADEGLRKVSARYCQHLSGLGRNAELFGLGNESVLEEVLVNLLRSGREPLEERGARGCAHVAMYPENKERLARLGAIEALTDLAKKTSSQSILGLVMAALLNLSTTPAYQVPICQQGLYVILSVNRAPHSSDDVRRFSTGVLLNLCQHPANRTRMYKAELRLKFLDADASDGSRPRYASTSPETRPAASSDPTSKAKLPGTELRRTSTSMSKRELKGVLSRSGTGLDFERLGSDERLQILRDWSSSMKENREQLAAAAQGLKQGLAPKRGVSFAGAFAIAEPKRSATSLGFRERDHDSESDESWSEDEEDPFGLESKRRFIEWMRSTWHGKKAPRQRRRNRNSAELEEYRACFSREGGTSKASQQIAGGASAGGLTTRFARRGSSCIQTVSPGPADEDSALSGESGALSVSASFRLRRATDLAGFAGFSSKTLSLQKSARFAAQIPEPILESPQEGIPVVSRSPTRSPTPGLQKATGRQSPVGKLSRLHRSLTRPVSEIWDAGKGSPGREGSPLGGPTGSRHTGWRPEVGGYKMEDDEVTRGASGDHAGLPGQRGAAAAGGARAPSPNPSKAGRKLTVIVDPDRPRNRVRFGELRTEINPLVEHLDMFTHLEGCTFCKTLYSHYTLPNGEMAHFFQHGKRLVDEVEIPLEPPSDPPVTFEDILQTGLPGPAPILRELAEIPPEALPKPFAPAPCLAPKPSRHLLPVVEHDCPNKDAAQCVRHGELESSNPLFVLEDNEPTTPTARESEHRTSNHPEFKVTRSIFAPRKKECDARSYFHHARLEDKIFEVDWTRIAKKTRFMKTLGSADDVARLRVVLRNNFMNIMHIFDYFGTMEISEPYAIQLKAYDLWLKSSKIPDETSAACKMTDCERVFISSNYEYDKNTLESEINDDNSLTRFEFIEALIRLAVAKYGDVSRKLNTPEAVERLLREHVFPNSPVPLDVDQNAFRKNQLYRPEIDAVFRAHEPLLRAIFGYYKGIRTMPNNPGRYMELPHWLDLVSDVRLLDPAPGAPETKGLFVYSRMLVADELLDHDRAVSCTFIDFLEMLARMAALKRFPGDRELEQRGFVGAHKLHAYLLAAHARTSARHSDEHRRVRTSVAFEPQPSEGGERPEPSARGEKPQPSDRRESSIDGEPPQPSDGTENAPSFHSSERASRSSGRLSSVRLSKPRISTIEGGPDAAEESPPGEVAGRPLHERLTQLLDLIFHRLTNLHGVKDVEHLRKKLVAAVKV
ncbi:hypothetical protein KFL_002440100 [Klebsormidium nitens]|uniref:Vacuolar protein 8 n=1 Tax=Klebsormidium nitens TaxID=105231 RepID=A0A1Y1I3T8_KLENI|nr:hypothetical protein KFL_002440100 [Klebsormidium nitens]|eukprot:GAQ85604.1 hypothetical protein KFL_002440100 [Klebsormidium nitens]